MTRMVPFHQSFESDDLSVIEVKNRVIENLDFIALQGITNVIAHAVALKPQCAEIRAERFDFITA